MFRLIKLIYFHFIFQCKRCKSVFHKTCKIEGKLCPKCLRKQQRRSVMGSEPDTPESQDYAFVPL